jgi:hypothetical protein
MFNSMPQNGVCIKNAAVIGNFNKPMAQGVAVCNKAVLYSSDISSLD